MNTKVLDKEKIADTTIFVTGGTGFLGSHLVRELLRRGYSVLCLKRATSNLERVRDIMSQITWVDIEAVNFEALFANTRIGCILHCATDYGRKQVDPLCTIEANLMLPLKLLHAATMNGVAMFINTDTILDKGVNNYSLSKKQFVDWLESYSDRITGINIALEHFYGPGDDSSKFVTYIVRALLSGVANIDLTPGYQRRDFIYIDDVTSAFMKLITNATRFERKFYRFEVGTHAPIEIRHFVDLAKRLSGNNNTRLNFGALPYRKNEVMDSRVNTSGLTALGWRPDVPLEEGLQRMINIERGKI